MSNRAVNGRSSLLLATTLATTAALAGCVSTGGARGQMIGAGVGAALGCAAGALITQDARGCAVGAAIGGAVGWGTVAISQYNARQVRSASEEGRMYGITRPVSTAQVKIREQSSLPGKVAPGGNVSLSMDYSVLLPPGQTTGDVKESWVLKKGTQTLANIPVQVTSRTAGGWLTTGNIPIPANATPGTYTIEHRVNLGSSYDMTQSTFVVGS